jgi:toxin-antitoxin system PIN domain toxin
VIVPDVNVLVFAYRREADRHERYARWLNQVVAGSDELGLVDMVLAGFLRIVTNPRILASPAPMVDAMAFVDGVRAAQRGRRVSATDSTWSVLSSLAAEDSEVRGNLVPDAWLAALARSHGATVATADRGFGRFPGLRFFDPGRVDRPS